MDSSLVLDVLLLLTLLGALVGGWGRGLGRTVGGLAGAVAGLAAAVVLVPWLGVQLGESAARIPVQVVAGVLVVSLGLAAGRAVGGLVRRGMEALRLSWVDAVAGAIGSATVVALAWMIAVANVPLLGSSDLTAAVDRSRGLTTLSAATPDTVRDQVSATRLVERARPWLAEVAGSPTEPPAIPDVDVDTAAIRASSASVVRISGAADACPGVVTGSGVVVAPDRVVTNAHVVAGMDAPTVAPTGSGAVTGRVVHLDETNDLAVIATDGLDVPALRVSDEVGQGDVGVVAGYPGGGPLTLVPAEVVSQRRTLVSSEGGAASRRVLTIAADVERGNSGGPVLDEGGDVAGIVFGQSRGVDDVGYAVPVSVVGPLVDRAPALASPVDTGTCRAAAA